MNSSFGKSKYFIIGLAILVLGGVVLAQRGAFNGTFLADVISPGTGSFYIEPSDAQMDLASSYLFTSYAKFSTGTVKMKSNWTLVDPSTGAASMTPTQTSSVQSTMKATSYTKTSTGAAPIKQIQTPVSGSFIKGCDNSETCEFHSGTVAGKLLLKAVSAKGESTATITVNNKLPANPFKDSVPDWAQAMVYSLYEKDIINGYANGSFGSADPVTRAQVIMLLTNLTTAYGIYPDGLIGNKNCDLFADVKKDNFAYKAVCFASYSGWLKDMGSIGNFKPNEPMLRHEVALVLANLMSDRALTAIFNNPNLTESILKSYFSAFFADVTLQTPNNKAILVMSNYGVMVGTYDFKTDKESFKPFNPINRAEMAVVIGRLMNYFKNKI